MKFLKLPSSCFRNDGFMDKFSRLFLKYFIYSFKLLTFLTISKKNTNSFAQFFVIPPFLKWEFGSSLENPSRIPL